MKGTSLGINVAYKIPISKSFFLKPGFGYYKYSFNHIRRENTLFGKSDVRNIKFTSPLFIPFYTDKYWYNSIAANIGFEKLFILEPILELSQALVLVTVIQSLNIIISQIILQAARISGRIIKIISVHL